MMGWNWNNQQQQQQQQSLLPGTCSGGGNNGPNGGGVCVKVMTDEQMELLRRQILAYAIISEELIEMHKIITAQQGPSAAARKNTRRHRWIPTPMQLQFLEAKFERGIGIPNKAKVAEITKELAQHGPVTQQNVYSWFQNKRTRTKRKQAEAQNNADPKAEAEIASSKENKTNAYSIPPFELASSNSDAENMFFQDAEINAFMHCLYVDSPRGNPLAKEIETPRSSSPYCHREGYDGMLA